MKMFKKNDGFTLVELIVVIAILAILAGVGVAGYSGYIAKANDAAVTTELAAIKTAVQGANATKGEIKEINIDAEGKVTFATGDALADDFYTNFKLYFTDCTVTTSGTGESITYTLVIKDFDKLIDGTSYKNGAKWTSTTGWDPAD